ncbi:hypothetical protein [Patulibacter minatonensis]|uniref:hypothetical protein n=1 Tax=Patulibacter minatonensis TaxID=298163 RepID=UPI00047EA767|nr:hypothetical protein [Patulibacter minatonensis]
MTPSRTRPSRPVRSAVAAAALLAALVVPATAGATTTVSSVAVTNGDAVVDKPLVFRATGQITSTSSGVVRVEINAPGIACAPTVGTNDGVYAKDTSVSAAELAAGASFTGDSIATAGTYTLCVYAADGYSSSTPLQSAASGPLTVREPQVSLAMSFPPQVKADVKVPLTLTTFAEVSRRVNVELNVGGVPCGPNQSANQQYSAPVYNQDVLGGPTTTTVNVDTPGTNGSYHLCGYLARSTDDATPLQVVDSGPFTVGPIPVPKCTISPSRLSAKGSVTVSCNALVTGQIAIVATRGKKVTTVTRTIVRGRAKASAKKLHLARGTTRIAVVYQSKKLTSKAVKRR